MLHLGLFSDYFSQIALPRSSAAVFRCQCRRLRSVRFCSNVKNIGEAAFACTSFFLQVSKPEGMTISADVFKYDEDMDKWGFWD